MVPFLLPSSSPLSPHHPPMPPPHVALLPSAGMGHLTPFLRLAAALADTGCTVTLITTQPMVSSSESRYVFDFLSSAPSNVHALEFHLADFDPSSADCDDPFFLQFEAIRLSAHLLPPLLSSSLPPLSALIIDVTLASTVSPVARELHLPVYVLFTSAALMLAFCLRFSFTKKDDTSGDGETTIDIPGLVKLPISWIPQPLQPKQNSVFFTTQFTENSRELINVKGIFVNTFEALEGEALSVFNAGVVVAGTPPVIPIGPLEPVRSERKGGSFAKQYHMEWLDQQPEKSVVYVSFGSRTELVADQMRELGVGLERSGCRFLWVVKTKKVDTEEEEGRDLNRILHDDGYLERVKGRGLVVKGWVEQEEVLGHRSVGAFLSHCGWNSVTEAALRGVKVLAWPRHGDQRMSANVVAKNGMGIWVKEWSWEGEEGVVKGEEIGEKVKELMEDGRFGEDAARVAAEARRAVGNGGRSKKALEDFVAALNSQLQVQCGRSSLTSIGGVYMKGS